MSKDKSENNHKNWLEVEIQDSMDEEFEMERDDEWLPDALKALKDINSGPTIDRRVYFSELHRLQGELVKLQDWISHTKAKVVVIFEGRDAAGKGGVIKRITQRLDPRVCKVVALPAPTEREQSQWYFQRFVPYLPAGGEMVLFDRSWYNRAGVERVMGFATKTQVEEFYNDVPEFERMLTRSGVILIKYWFSISDQEQQLRFMMRIHDPIRQWKLSEMDLQSRIKWEAYTKQKEKMLKRTNIEEAPWFIVEANDKKRARLNCIDHLLSQIDYEAVEHQEITLPDREFNADYERSVMPKNLYVPEKY